MKNSDPSLAGEKFHQLVQIMARLRSPDGCPWDREQSFATLKKYLVEESYEVLDAIDAEDWAALSEELGDLMLQPVFLAQMASEQNLFSIADALDAINEKLVRRHPHVFGDAEARTAQDVTHRWEQIKSQERQAKGKLEKGAKPEALLEAVPRNLPALVEGQKIGSRVAKVGFDWTSVEQVLDKLHEEVAELEEARRASDRAHLEEELGDMLFVMVNLARKLDIDAEQALRGANAKFRRRFAFVEQALRADGRPLGEATLEEMEEKWQQAKQAPK
ncbi:MAG: nucleoside triphosphate pyrophosphohydrolase [Bryobacteraceae bacterium]